MKKTPNAERRTPNVQRLLLISVVCLLTSVPAGCATYNPAATPAGSRVVATVADRVIQLGLSAAATKMDTAGNPYLHSLADALRTNPDGIVDPALVEKLAKDYGDPENQHKFRVLARDLWNIAKSAAWQMGKENVAELLAKGLNDGGVARRTEVGSQRAEVEGQKSEVGGRRSEVGAEGSR